MRTHILLALGLLGGTLACREEAGSPTAPDASPSLAGAATPLVFAQMSAGNNYACGVTSDDRLYCWGGNDQGQVGDGSTTDRLAPVPVGGALRFRQVAAGFRMTCAVSTDDRAYCWGPNDMGELGDGTTTPRLTPAPVAGAHRFRRVDVGVEHACAVTRADRAFCWGDNRKGELGIGNVTGPENNIYGAHSSKPVAVAGGLSFRHLAAGYTHTCGVTTGDRVFCWGYNRYGQVGDGSTGWLKVRPVRVADTRQYRQVDAGRDYTCAVTTGDRAFCWGYGSPGTLGNGTKSSARKPAPVSGGLSFERVSAGDFHTCAETTVNRAYCWGDNAAGNLGDGTEITRLTPVAVVGGLSFAQLSAGGRSCGKTPQGLGYCWGANGDGALGTGNTASSSTPVPVAPPL
jgi:alpha-tubulin suppressor-like RCC1 family protein